MAILRLLWRLAVVVTVVTLYLVTPRASLAPAQALDFRLTPLVAGLPFDFLRWEVEALLHELEQRRLAGAVPDEPQRQRSLLEAYFQALQGRHELEDAQIRALGESSLVPGSEATVELQAELEELEGQVQELQPQVETILTRHMEGLLLEQGLGAPPFRWFGVPFPPVLAQFTTPPLALIISPRDEIRVERQVYLEPGMTPGDMTDLEVEIDRLDGYVSLVIPIGGLSTYPTMILPTGSPQFAVSATAHEWAHAYLFLHPLGNAYDRSSEMRIVNETVADIVGREVAAEILPRFGYEPPAPPAAPPEAAPTDAAREEQAFDFRLYMRDLRLEVDELLAAGNVEEAEQMMEEARDFLATEHKIVIRKINQAYFAFFGTYEGGPGAVSPIPEQVRTYRRRFDSLGDFLRQMATMSSYEEFERRLASGG